MTMTTTITNTNTNIPNPRRSAGRGGSLLGIGALGLLSMLCGPEAPTASADAFDRLEGPALEAAFDAAGTNTENVLTRSDLGRLPRVLPGVRSGLVLMRTDQGNVCRMLVSVAFRARPQSQLAPKAAMTRPDTPNPNPNPNPASSAPKPDTPKAAMAAKPEATPPQQTPVVVIERLDTFLPGGKTPRRLAQARDLVLFDGFRVDLDSALVVPNDQGEDFVVQDQGLEAMAGLQFVTLTQRLTAAAPSASGLGKSPQPSPDKKIVPTDFAGTYQLNASGEWQGRLVLEVDAVGKVRGSLRSDRNGAVYNVEGDVSPRIPNRVDFSIIFPQTHQDYEAYLWTEGKNTLSGKLIMGERTFGFYATRVVED